MTPALVQPWIALGFGLGAAAFSLSALNARSLIVSVLSMMAAGALAVVSLLATNDKNAALIQALVGVGLTPPLLLAALLLSARTVKASRSAWTWATGGLAAAVGLILLWTLFAAGGGSARIATIAAHSSILALTPLLLALAAAGAALLGFGERGAMDQSSKGRSS